MAYTIHQLLNQNIYFLCNGTSMNDIINSISANNGSFFNKLFSHNNSIKKEKFSKLTDIGIKESIMCNQNTDNKNIFHNVEEIYTSLDYNSIETALIIFNSISKVTKHTIYPLPDISNQTNIESIKTFDIFKKKFGYEGSPLITNVSDYWKLKEIDNNFLNIRNTSNININWRNINYKNPSSLSNYNLNKFIKKLEEIVLENHKAFRNVSSNIKPIIIICNSNLILDLLRKFRNIRFNKKIDVIEYTSLWKMNFNFEFSIDITGQIKNKKIKDYNYYEKEYPKEFNHEPLKLKSLNYKTDLFTYKYNNVEFCLFNSLKKIPLKYIRNMNLNYISESNNKRRNIKKKLNHLKVNNNQNKLKDDNKTNNKKSNNKQGTFESFK